MDVNATVLYTQHIAKENELRELFFQSLYNN